jgi:hypothetical protein
VSLAGDNDTGEVSVTDNKDIGKAWITSKNEASPILLTLIRHPRYWSLRCLTGVSGFTHEAPKDSNILENVKNI